MKKILFIFVLLISFNLNAFEVKGFKGGMSYDEVVAKAESKSWYLKPFADVKNTYDIKNQKDITELNISLCESNKKVYWLSYNGDAENFHIYPKLILNYEKQGFRIHDTSVYSNIGYDGSEYNSMDIIMRSNSHDYEIGLNLYSTDKNGVSNYQIIFSYDKNNYCNN